MSHIIKNNDDIEMFIDDVNWIKKHGISVHIVKEILKQMISVIKIDCFVEYGIYDENYKIYQKGGLYYDTVTYKMIHVYMNGLNSYLQSYYKCMEEDFNITPSNEIMAYILIDTLAHEVEHAYQDFIGKYKSQSPIPLISSAYKGLFDIIKNEENNSKLLLKYFINCNNLLLERNAQIESFDLVMQCSKYANQETIYNAYKEWIKGWILLGYYKNNKGSIYETYDYLGLKDKYDSFNCEVDISEEERIRYGLPIEDSTRKRLLGK